MKYLENKITVITGAARGLGKYLSRKLADEGCHLVICDLDEKGVKDTKSEIEKDTGKKVIAIRVDITNEEDVKDMVQIGIQEFGRIDLLVANAGLSLSGSLFEFDLQSWKKIVDVNLFGYFLCAREVSKVMRKNNYGVIVQINSRTGKRGSVKNSAYSASKGGGIVLTQSLSAELAEFNIRVNCVCPGPMFESDLWQKVLFDDYSKRFNMTKEEVKKKYLADIPQKRGCTYEDVADMVIFLLSDKASHITGQAINIDGGSTVW